MTRLALILAVCLPLDAWGSATGSLSADYTGYSHGLTVLKLSGSIDLSPDGYTVHVTFHTAGLIGMLVHSDNDSIAYGSISGDTIRPARFAGTGHLRGTYRETLIDYVNGTPFIRRIQPPVEEERSAVNPEDTRQTIDTLSAVALLIRQVGQTGTCRGEVRTFDGRRLAEQRAYPAGVETLVKTDRSIFSGPAFRCNLEGRQLGGFVRNEDEGTLRKPRLGAAWFADIIRGAPPVPVRVNFENKILGQVTLFLTAVRGGPTPAIAQCCSSAAPPTP